ncbi:hypothetical protein [Kitasatospora sp. NPDC059571]|uniref:hypothetical protein n=1 Tax=Kitasatospora sp. NPDC059571 TaxID=3346871 RepID=UPI00368F00AA
MKLRSVLAVSAIPALVAGVALAGAAVAGAAVLGVALAASPDPPVIPRASGTVALGGFPATVAAGGAEVSFTEVITNTGDDAVVLPVAFLGSTTLTTGQIEARYQNPYTRTWVDAHPVANAVSGPGIAVALSDLRGDSSPDRDSLLFVAAGRTLTVQVRLALTPAAAAGAATAAPYVRIFPADREHAGPDSASLVSGTVSAFTVTAPGRGAAAPASGAPSAPPPTAGSADVPAALVTKVPSADTVDRARAQAGRQADAGDGGRTTAVALIAAAVAGALAAAVATRVLLRRRRA